MALEEIYSRFNFFINDIGHKRKFLEILEKIQFITNGDIPLDKKKLTQKFLSLPDQQKQFGIKMLKHRVELNDLNVNNNSLADMAQYVLRKMNLQVDPEFFVRLKQGDIVEIYDLSHNQIFANFEFFKHCSYDLVDLLTYTWDELFYRSEEMTRDLLAIINRIMSTGKHVQRYEVRPHIVKEKKSEQNLSFIINMDSIAPVKDATTGEITGIIHNLRVRRLESSNLVHIDF